jgi:protein TonB
MKRKNEKVPGFDEIIFENRNKTYGAYNLRKQYKSAASISILGGIALSTILISALSLTTEKGTAGPQPIAVMVELTDPIVPKIVPPSLPKAPDNQSNVIRNLKPEVTDDTSQVTHFIPTTEEIYNNTQNGVNVDTFQTTIIAETVIPKEPEPFIFVEEMPEFPGGLPALMKFIGDNLKYPEEAISTNIQGKVFLKFVVNPDGSADRISVIRGVDPLLDNEATRVAKMLPKFKPGKQGGIPVPVWFVLPVNFKLENK